ncbi:hypothetical protein BH23ACT6_BH23ACT6_25670 [soil metagenome]
MTVVIDASLVVALVVDERRQKAVQVLLADGLDTGEELHAPDVMPYEVANVLARLSFDGALVPDDLVDIWQDVSALGIVLHSFDLTNTGSSWQR